MTPPAAVGDIVHYRSYGTPGGEFTSECRAAIVTAVGDSEWSVGLAVINPTGLFFHPLSDGGCRFDQPDDGISQPRGGTWHHIDYHF